MEEENEVPFFEWFKNFNPTSLNVLEKIIKTWTTKSSTIKYMHPPPKGLN